MRLHLRSKNVPAPVPLESRCVVCDVVLLTFHTVRVTCDRSQPPVGAPAALTTAGAAVGAAPTASAAATTSAPTTAAAAAAAPLAAALLLLMSPPPCLLLLYPLLAPPRPLPLLGLLLLLLLLLLLPSPCNRCRVSSRIRRQVCRWLRWRLTYRYAIMRQLRELLTTLPVFLCQAKILPNCCSSFWHPHGRLVHLLASLIWGPIEAIASLYLISPHLISWQSDGRSIYTTMIGVA